MYVPTLYLAEGIPYGIVNSVSTIMYKTLGMPNEFIGFTSILYLPWVVKMLWSPIVDIWGTRRRWIMGMQWMLMLMFALLAVSLQAEGGTVLSLAALAGIALCSATNDVATDGFYMTALEKREQAFFIGIRSTCYRLALVLAGGALVIVAGRIAKATGSTALSWSWSMGIGAGAFFVFALLHTLYLPFPPGDGSGHRLQSRTGFIDAFKSYFQQPRIAVVLAFILVYRLGEALLLKMAAPFLLDLPENGGLGLATDTVGFVYGTLGVIGLCVGGMVGGWAIARWGIRRCMWPMAVMLNAPNLFYVWLALARPPLPLVAVMVTTEQIGYGFGFSAFAVFLMDIACEPYKTSHFAISTGFMALGMMVPGMVSGLLQSELGYFWFFMAVVAAGLPGLALIRLLPMQGNGSAKQEKGGISS